ncbi:hypothetical protein HanRHA438_Chr17g0835451 [Helianthus annuus]|nr:hypothetical protein HanRHA438_Chr17g0835451 [Helianthus annuus]
MTFSRCINTQLPSGNASMGELLSFSFRRLKASSCFGPHTNFAFFSVKLVKGVAIFEKSRINLW